MFGADVTVRLRRHLGLLERPNKYDLMCTFSVVIPSAEYSRYKVFCGIVALYIFRILKKTFATPMQ